MTALSFSKTHLHSTFGACIQDSFLLRQKLIFPLLQEMSHIHAACRIYFTASSKIVAENGGFLLQSNAADFCKGAESGAPLAFFDN